MMRYKINKTQYNLITEETLGIDIFLSQIKDNFNLDDTQIEKINKFIENSECQKITVEPLKMGRGVSLDDRVILNSTIFNNNLPNFLFILFHEIAHQYQFKKYGAEKMYECYLGNVTLMESAIFMKKIEMVADEFAKRKLREFVKFGIIKANEAKFEGFYKNVPSEHFVGLISQVRTMLKNENITNPKEISELFYNWVKKDM